jgi:hypothetical protein
VIGPLFECGAAVRVENVHPGARVDVVSAKLGVIGTAYTWRAEVTVREIAANRLRIGPIEAIDGTPVVDLKPVLGSRAVSGPRGRDCGSLVAGRRRSSSG